MENGCIYDGKCRLSIVVYEAKCKCCGKVYIDYTQQKLKTCVNQHFSDTRRVMNCEIQTDSFAKKFAMHCEDKIEDGSMDRERTSDIRDLVEIKVLRKGNSITCNKSFGKLNCLLCINERIAILKKHEKR